MKTVITSLLGFFFPPKVLLSFPPELVFHTNGIRKEALWNARQIRVVTHSLVRQSYLPYVSQKEV